ncbi:hypothetical protein CAP42_07310 [Acinetobacter indicus]|uniref:hypothetical protein n=1 Tax=Acinetobacter indicus TaxID=756892 RepID=UPI000B3E848D|nr:hypothetical protein [Acinetobacter indicus]OUY10151.1 hypothetical protein CAP42_07310 [Acinetobacter indicus]
MNKNIDFYKFIKIIYSNAEVLGANRDQLLQMDDVINVYQLVDEVVPFLLESYKGDLVFPDDRFNQKNIRLLIDALKRIKFFPNFRLEDINQNHFFELRKFLTFVQKTQSNPKIQRKYQSIVLVDESSGCWKLDEEDYAEEFLKEYLAYRYKSQQEKHSYVEEQSNTVQVFSDHQDEALEKFALDVKQDISSLLEQAGMLYVIAAKITFRKDGKQLSNFNRIINKKSKLLNCLKANESIIRILYKPFRATEDNLEYYAVFFVQSASPLNEDIFVQQIADDLSASLSIEQDTSVQISVQNLNNVLRQSLFPSFQLKHFLLIDGVDDNWAFIQKWFLGFLYQLERLGEIQDKPKQSQEDYIHEVVVSALRKIKLNSGTERIELKFTYLRANDPQDIQHLLFFCLGRRAKTIWNIAHLSENAREYIQRISIIYQENFAAWDMQQYLSLAVEIETFIMTLKESAYDAFYPGADTVRDKLTKQSENIESLITRQLLQFSCILRNRDNLGRLQRKLEGKTVSRTLKYFFLIYKKQTCDEYLASMLDTFLGVEIKEKRIKEQFDSIVAEYRFTQPLFFKAESRQKQIKKSSEIIPPEMGTQQVDETTLERSDLIEEAGFQDEARLDVESTDVEQPEQSLMSIDQPVETTSRPIKAVDQPYKLFHVQRHLSRLAKVEAMLKSAMKTDVVIVRCLFGCNPSFRLTYKDFSEIFSGMLQDNKKRKPISEITAYLGYWDGNERNSQDQITSYAANVVFMFKAQTLVEHPDLFSELERLWQFACRKIESDYDSGMRVNGYVKKLQIAHVLKELQCTQVVVETTQKQLSKKIVEHLASYIVYQDLLDDNIYQELPKWLIKKNGSSGKTKTSKRVYNKT